VISVNAIVWAPVILYVVELIIKIVALGTIPGNRRPSSSIAWLLLIVVTPILGLVIFLLIGSPFVRGRRAKVQAEANKVISERSVKFQTFRQDLTSPLGWTACFG
jgi:cardiolipin synthase